MKAATTLFLTFLVLPLSAQQEPVVDSDGDQWSEGFGRAPSYRAALAGALEDAVARAKGIAIARGPAVRSRLAVVSEAKDADGEGWFDGQSENEREWVQRQVRGFVERYEITDKGKAQDRMWEVRVRALVLGHDGRDAQLVVDLRDNDLRAWRLERVDEETDRLVDQRKGRFVGPKIAEYLRNSGAVKIVSRGPGVQVTANSAAKEREKAGHELVASHRVTIDWQPLVVQSRIEKRNRARPSNGPRPEYMSGGSVTVRVRIEDLVERTELCDKTITIPADKPGRFSADRLDAMVTELVDKAKAEVAKQVFFTLRPPVVLRKWTGEGGEWLIEARIGKRVAAGFRKFVVGSPGSLASPDWRKLGDAELIGGTAASCTFRMLGGDPAALVAEVSEVRPVE
ncbi:MAG TPA: hypothetical protein ENI87_11255 [bacterium]|nr:hypothetical protein [bacterium]